jgi:hypothetical protein
MKEWTEIEITAHSQCYFPIVIHFASQHLSASLSDCCSERSLLYVLGYHIELVLQPEELKSNTPSGRPGMGSFLDGSMFILGDEHWAPGTTRAGAFQFGASTQGQSISMASMGLKGTDQDSRAWPPADLLEDRSWFVSKPNSWILVSALSITFI